NVNFDSTFFGPDQTLDDDWVLIALVLHKKRVPGVIDKSRDSFASIDRAPDQMRVFPRCESHAMPVGIEAADHLADLVWTRGADDVIACLRQVLRFPVEGPDKGHLIIDDQRLLMGQTEGRISILDLDTRFDELFPGVPIVVCTISARGIKHYLNFDATAPGCRDCLEQGLVGEDEHLY